MDRCVHQCPGPGLSYRPQRWLPLCGPTRLLKGQPPVYVPVSSRGEGQRNPTPAPRRNTAPAFTQLACLATKGGREMESSCKRACTCPATNRGFSLQRRKEREVGEGQVTPSHHKKNFGLYPKSNGFKNTSVITPPF